MELEEEAKVAEPDPLIDCSDISEAEVATALRRMKYNKAAGICNIPAELLKYGGSSCTEWLTRIFQVAWRTGTIPEDWKYGIVQPFYKGKGSRKECKNYRGITLLSVPGKVFAHVLLTRVKDRLLQLRRKEQSGFTPGRSTADRIFFLSTLIQTRNEYRRPLWIAYIDLKAAFNSLDRAALWTLLLSTGLPQKIVDLMKELYTDTVSAVRIGGHLSEWFTTGSGVRQGCTIAPNIFLPPMDRILNRTVDTA